MKIKTILSLSSFSVYLGNWIKQLDKTSIPYRGLKEVSANKTVVRQNNNLRKTEESERKTLSTKT